MVQAKRRTSLFKGARFSAAMNTTGAAWPGRKASNATARKGSWPSWAGPAVS